METLLFQASLLLLTILAWNPLSCGVHRLTDGQLGKRRLIRELLEDAKQPEEVSEDEVTWETVQDVFDRVQDRSWQLLADDLTVCIRPDGSDWILGAGGFGRVCCPAIRVLRGLPEPHW